MTMTKPTSEQVTFLAAGSGAVQRTALDKFRDVVSVKDFGAIGDDVANDTAALQAAIAYAISNKKLLYVPSGVYRVFSPLTWNGTLQMVGAGRSGISSSDVGIVTFRAMSVMSAIIQGPTTWPDGSTYASYIDGINFECMQLADRGIDGITNHSIIRNSRASNCKLAGFRIGGICNSLEHLSVNYSQGDGVQIVYLANQTILYDIKPFGIDGYGITVDGTCEQVKILGGVVEDCKKGGIFIRNGVRGFSIDGVYFEGNAAVGHTFTSPTTYTVQCDVIVNGESSPTTIGDSTPCTGSITNCTTTTQIDGFVFANGFVDGVIECNRSTAVVVPRTTPVMTFYGTASTSSIGRLINGVPKNIRISRNSNFGPTTACDPFNFTTGAARVTSELGVASVSVDTAIQNNIAVQDFNLWSQISGGTGSFVRSSEAFPFNPLVPVWEFQYATGPSGSGIFGWQLNAANYPQYHGKLLIWGVWVKAPFSNPTATGYVSLVTSAQSESTLTDYASLGWTRKLNFFRMPTTGTLNIGIKVEASGSSANTPAVATPSGSAYVAAPVMCEWGADYDRMWGQYAAQTQFSGTAAPSAGTWKRGDVVWNTTPSAGGDPGWMCVTAGTPGTWKAMANLDA